MKLWLAATLVVLAWTAPQNVADEIPPASKTSECGLYLAESSTSTAEDPKWGLYAGKVIPKSSPIGYGEVAIQTFHLMANAMGQEKDEMRRTTTNLRPAIVNFLEQYIWVPHGSGGQYELEDPGRIVMAVPGVGVLGGSNPKLTNAEWNHSLAYHRPAWGETPGLAHPGRGASSSYFDVTLSTTEKIPAGMEIFINYGDNWKSEEDKDDKSEDELLLEDHPKIDETIDKMIAFFEKHTDALDPQSKEDIYKFLIQDVLYAAAGKKKGELISSLLPATPDELNEVKENGGAMMLSFPTIMRTPSWLKENGICMDNIRPGPSTIPHAGRGAFASRPIKTGTTVAPVPLIHLADSEIMKIYPLVSMKDEENKRYYVRGTSQPTGTQLLLNYCLGHPDSRLLFFPSGAGFSFVNHSPEPNARLVWSDHSNNRRQWLDLEPKLLHQEENEYLGLMMDVVATKDIAEGEEITINYGPEWEAAWNEHVTKWQALSDSGAAASWPLRSLEYNNMFLDKPIPLNQEEHPENLMIKCFLVVKRPEGESPINSEGEKVRIWAGTENTMKSENLFDCILSDVQEVRTPDGTRSWNYTVKWNGKSDSTWVRHVPQKAIVFVDKPGTSDQHMVDSFRHYIGIPDDIFPKGPWRNINEVEEEEYEEEYEEESEDENADDHDFEDEQVEG